MEKKKPTPAKVKPSTYQPTAAELAEDLSVDATPEEVAEAVMESVAVYENDDEKSQDET